MQYKTFLVIFLAYLLVTEEALAFWGALAKGALKLIPSLVSSFTKKDKRALKNIFDPYQKNLDLELERLLSQLQ
uniref:Heterin-2 n=1 Tax=Heterometrus spinifer TaxID=118530 RepID=NDB3_HETSP|nr:RecName: Full=Heterin-2; Flags: Precursor [Heterometrus spinifer]AGK88595.1 heterin 2 [Heterometrus spinifer]AGK88596.1 heterin 2 [Heterometrus spinifer]